MRSKYVLMSLMLLPWGMMTQAWGQHCPCADKETLSINLAHNQAGLDVANAVLPRLQDPSVVAYAKASIVEHQFIIKELQKLSIDAGIPEKPSPLSEGTLLRGQQAVANFAKLSGAALDSAYMEYRFTELQMLLTAFDTYFFPTITTAAMKAWTAQERPKLAAQFETAKSIQSKLVGGVALSY